MMGTYRLRLVAPFAVVAPCAVVAPFAVVVLVVVFLGLNCMMYVGFTSLGGEGVQRELKGTTVSLKSSRSAWSGQVPSVTRDQPF